MSASAHHRRSLIPQKVRKAKVKKGCVTISKDEEPELLRTFAESQRKLDNNAASEERGPC